MSLQDQGLLVFGTSGTDHQRDASYDSRLGRLQADLRRNPAHMAIIDNFPGGSALSANGSNNTGQTIRTTETLLAIPHNLPYTPEVLLYMFVKSVGGNPAAARAGGYAASAFFYAPGSGTFEDNMYIEVDRKEVRVMHEIVDYGFGVSYTSPAPTYLFRLKYYILSNPSHVEKYRYGEGGIVG